MRAFPAPLPKLKKFLATALFLIFAWAKAQAGIPNVELPAQIVAPEGKLTVFANYAARNYEGVPVYVVNRTDKPITFASQDGDIYLMLEYRVAKNYWQRAEPHANSFCGNSYYSLTLPPGQHLVYQENFPTEGERATVRYATFRGEKLVSNETEGFIVPSVVEIARKDSLARRVSDSLEQLLDPRQQYMGNSSSPESKVAGLRLLQAAGMNPYYQEAAAGFAKGWETKSTATPEEKEAAKAIREILAGPWPAQRDFNALFRRCEKVLHSPKGAKIEFGQPEKFPRLAWNVLRDLKGQEGFEAAEKWKPVIATALADPTVENIDGVIALAGWPNRIADELLPNSFFEQQLSAHPGFGEGICAATLSRRGQWSKLVEIGWKLPPKSQLIVLRALAYVDSGEIPELGRDHIREPDQEDEQKFWKHCLETQPMEAAFVLRSLIPTWTGSISPQDNPFGSEVRRPLHDFLASESEQSKKKGKEFKLEGESYKMRLLVDFLASWEQEKDTPLLRDLLTFNGYEESGLQTSADGHRTQTYRFGVRQAAKAALLKRGQPVPTDLVLEKTYSLPKEE
jgi:hypothetical protein